VVSFSLLSLDPRRAFTGP